MNNKNLIPSFFALIKRHLLVFFKSASTVIFTLMVPLAVFAIYVLFLRQLEISQIDAYLKDALITIDKTTTEGKAFYHQIYGIADTWMIAGVLSVSSITVSLNANYLVVRDKENGIAKDFISSPLSPSAISFSYLFFDVVISFLINLVVYLICLIYLACYGAYLISVIDFFAIIGVLLFASISASLITYFICSFIKSESNMASIVAIGSAAVGFLVGAYLPSGIGPKYMDYITTFFPGTYCTGLLRNYFMRNPIEKLKNNPIITNSENGLTFINNLEEQFSLNIDFFSKTITPPIMVLVVLLFMILFIILTVIFANRNYMNFLKEKSLKIKKNNKKSAK